ncbi:MAG: guanylate kinase [Nitrospirota bacterium]
MSATEGMLYVVSAPSGTGKTTLVKEVINLVPNIEHSVSYTTRVPRKGEINDKDYTFISRDEFKAMIKIGEFVEWAEVHGSLYGTSIKRLESLRKLGKDVILDIDIQGAKNIKKKYREGIFIFILPPSLSVLKKRLKKRMTDTPEEMEKRMKRAKEEIAAYKMYDYVVVNNNFDEALMALKCIIIAERCRAKRLGMEKFKGGVL